MNLNYKILFAINIITTQIIFNIHSMRQKDIPHFSENTSDIVIQEDEDFDFPPMEDMRTLLVNNKQTLAVKNQWKSEPVILDKNIQFTPLMENILKRSEQAVDKLIEDKIDVNESINDISPLLLAIYMRNIKIIQSLLDAGADISQDILIYANQVSKEISDLLEKSLKKKISTIKNQLKSDLPTKDLQNICLDYLDIPKEMFKK